MLWFVYLERRFIAFAAVFFSLCAVAEVYSFAVGCIVKLLTFLSFASQSAGLSQCNSLEPGII